MTTYSLRSASPARTRADAVVVGVVAGDKGPRLWQTRDTGLPARITMPQEPFTLGTGVLPQRGGLRSESGLLIPGYDGD